MTARCPGCRVDVLPTRARRCPWCDHTFPALRTTAPPTDWRIELPGLMASRILPVTTEPRHHR